MNKAYIIGKIHCAGTAQILIELYCHESCLQNKDVISIKKQAFFQGLSCLVVKKK